VKYFTPGVSWMEFTDEGVNADGTYTTTEVSSATTYRARLGGSDTPGVADLTVPAEPGTYRLVTTATRPSVLSPAVRSEWTLTTGHTENGVRTPLDLLDLGFVLPLDGHNKASVGKKLTGTVTVRHQPGPAGTSPVRAVSVDVSYDNGKTCHRATVKETGHGTWSVSIPKGGRPGGFATLRASAVDKAGNRVQQTITRAYGLR
jgi:hypothetical protein